MSKFLIWLQEKPEEAKLQQRKYSVRPPRDLRSKYILKMEARRKREEEEAEAKRIAEENEKIAVTFCYIIIV